MPELAQLAAAPSEDFALLSERDRVALSALHVGHDCVGERAYAAVLVLV